MTIRYKRVLLKLSGEALMGNDAFGINRTTIMGIVGQIVEIAKMGVEVGVVVGGGNLFRGVAAQASDMDRATADYMGMLATVMNALALKDAFESLGQPACNPHFPCSRLPRPMPAPKPFNIWKKAKW